MLSQVYRPVLPVLNRVYVVSVNSLITKRRLLQSAFSLKIRLVLILASAIANHDVMLQ